jgi:hypothetical protein
MPFERKIQEVNWFQRSAHQQSQHELSQVDGIRDQILQ